MVSGKTRAYSRGKSHHTAGKGTGVIFLKGNYADPRVQTRIAGAVGVINTFGRGEITPIGVIFFLVIPHLFTPAEFLTPEQLYNIYMSGVTGLPPKGG